MSKRFRLREAVNVPDLERRDALVRRCRKIRSNAVQTKADIDHWNSAHPHEEPISTDFEDATIAWCDGVGPPPAAAPEGERTP